MNIDTLAQSYIFRAPVQAAADERAEELLRRVLCAYHTGCGKCPGCAKFESREHTDLLVIETREKVIKVESVQPLAEFLKLQPLEAPRRCIWIREAHKMNPAVQNKLLKSLEDPPPATLFALSTSRPEALLPTVRSRCIDVAVRPDLSLLREPASDRERIARALCGGFIQAEAQMLEDEEYFSMRAAVLDVCADICHNKNTSALERAGRLAPYAERSEEWLLIAARFFLDAQRAAMGARPRFSPDCAAEVNYCAKVFTSVALCRILEEVRVALDKKSLCAALSARLMTEALMVRIAEHTKGTGASPDR